MLSMTRAGRAKNCIGGAIVRFLQRDPIARIDQNPRRQIQGLLRSIHDDEFAPGCS